MKILSVTPLAIADVKVVRFARFCDQRGYFSEHFRASDFASHPELAQFADPAAPLCSVTRRFHDEARCADCTFSGSRRWASWCGHSRVG
jgi:hypothetical protein